MQSLEEAIKDGVQLLRNNSSLENLANPSIVEVGGTQAGGAFYCTTPNSIKGTGSSNCGSVSGRLILSVLRVPFDMTLFIFSHLREDGVP